MADARDQRLTHFVRTFSISIDRYFPMDIKFAINNRVYNEKPGSGATLVERTYARGKFTMSFCAASTSSRTPTEPAPQPSSVST